MEKGGRGREARKEGKGAWRKGCCPCPGSFLRRQSRFHPVGTPAEGLGLLGCAPTGVAGIEAVTTDHTKHQVRPCLLCLPHHVGLCP